MKYEIEVWRISDLVEEYKKGNLSLNPPYQRRFIWALSDQQTLIESINNGFAIPNIFLFQKGQDKYEMVDGQQRTRTILAFVDGQFKSKEGLLYSKNKFPDFLDYKIPVTVITKIGQDESIEDFYTLVNKAGIHLNRPELKKAEFFDTNFLKLINELADSPQFKSLELFTESSEKRMNDVDFISELVTQQIEGITDKKVRVDKIFEKDISDTQYEDIKGEFLKVLNILIDFNNQYSIKKTRYKQRNDLYTLFGFIHDNLKLRKSAFLYFYELLVYFNDDINPSNEKCEAFQMYAFHCVSQSNSKYARTERANILKNLFLNPKEMPNRYQKQVLKYYGADASFKSMKRVATFLTFDLEKI